MFKATIIETVKVVHRQTALCALFVKAVGLFTFQETINCDLI